MRIIAVAACICTTGFFLFNIMWGFNYCRLPLEKSLGYKAGTPTPAELAAAMTKERNAVNLLCSSGSIHFSGGHSHYSGGFYKIADSVNNGYYALTKDTAESNGIINNIQPHPKSITASGLLSYTGIAGIFIPFTYESNVNTDPGMPDFTLPFSATHESAHFKGFAREDEANFIAYLASSHNSDPYFQYSAHLEAFIYLSNALFTADYSAWQHINSGLDLRAAGDLKYFNDFLTAHQSKVTEISEKVNDNYLKSQGQQGIVSYDLFVTLLCDRYRSK